VRTDQFHYTQLQTARQRRNEGPQEFADRCRAVAQKLVSKTDDPEAQRIHQENAEHMLLAAFVSGWLGPQVDNVVLLTLKHPAGDIDSPYGGSGGEIRSVQGELLYEMW